MNMVFIECKDIEGKEVRFIDTRFDLGNANAGREMYNVEHLEGAVYWDLEKDLSDMNSKYGRHPMISKEKMTALVQQTGLSIDDSIVIYDQGGSPFALRAYFLLEWAGFSNIHVLREGFEEAKKVLPLSKEKTNYNISTVSANWKDELYVDIETVKRIVAGEVESQLVDARANIRYRGEVEPIDAIAGHIPTALNYDWEQLKKDGKFLKQELLIERLNGLTDKSKPVTVYCGSGVTAAPLYASLKEAGYENVQLYVGSYSDWIRENEVEKE
ncbi:sulfurtransferase [Psychrobacillus vulpis]|uniref:Sulfurtransferase n=1 Tax=Psychrobacillus vulpis TaxID=2325572 RepID=A0A544TQK6_9BACI|nr:sulfurtransferase [Psychrobacillus vulpis]TQR19724.1 sulfurtransferase [Psychrobacillus vulpis]